MLRRLTCLLALAAGASLDAGIWPEQFGTSSRASSKPLAVTDQAVWDEYGLEEAERAEYTSPAGNFTGTAWRLKDSTGALAVFQWQRPAQATPSKLGALAVEFPGGVLVAFGNYCFQFAGRPPQSTELQDLFTKLPRLDQSPLPTLPATLPAQDRLPNSERYVVGPATLERFGGRIPPSVAAFHYGVEAQVARFRSPAGEMALAIFSFPTHHIARDREPEFRKLPGAMVKRSGPLIAVVTTAPDPDEAEKLLSRVRYQASITWSEYVPSRRDNIGNLIINIFILIGILLTFSLVAGLAFGGLRALARRVFGLGASHETVITLRLDQE